MLTIRHPPKSGSITQSKLEMTVILFTFILSNTSNLSAKFVHYLILLFTTCIIFDLIEFNLRLTYLRLYIINLLLSSDSQKYPNATLG